MEFKIKFINKIVKYFQKQINERFAFATILFDQKNMLVAGTVKSDVVLNFYLQCSFKVLDAFRFLSHH